MEYEWKLCGPFLGCGSLRPWLYLIMLLFLFPLGWGEAKTKWLWKAGVKDYRAATSLGPLNKEESQSLEHFPPWICCFVQSLSCV